MQYNQRDGVQTNYKTCTNSLFRPEPISTQLDHANMMVIGHIAALAVAKLQQQQDERRVAALAKRNPMICWHLATMVELTAPKN